MGYDYALVHLYYNIPPAIALTLVYYPLFTYIDIYKITFLISIAVTATIPWDSYLIRNNVWSYPPDAIIGPTLFDIPAEELFFFVIQTYNTSLLYLLLSKPTFHPAYLCGKTAGKPTAIWSSVGTTIIGATAGLSWWLVRAGGEGFYIGLINIWAGSFMTLLWTIAHQLILTLPLSNTLVPIMLPTIYLWIVDTIALQRGTWVIETGTKLGIELWPGLEFEEAFFFFATNCMIVFGLIAFDNSLAVMHAFPALFPSVPSLPSPWQLIQALLLPRSRYDEDRIAGFNEALNRLRRKSRSFYLASGVFQGRLRTDLVLLYSFCRVADDLIDDAKDLEEARHWLQELTNYLKLAYSIPKPGDQTSLPQLDDFINNTFPNESRSALKLLPTEYLSSKPLYNLLKGLEMDLQFSVRASAEKDGRGPKVSAWPIINYATLHLYGERVAGTVAESCIELAYHHAVDHSTSYDEKMQVIAAGGRMGVALQLVNVARDISVDAEMCRLYIPSDWLVEEGISPREVLKLSASGVAGEKQEALERLRQRLLAKAFLLYREARPWIEMLPYQARASMRVAVESYMEIGRVLDERSTGNRIQVKQGRATVPKWRRVMVAWRALVI